MEKLLKKAKIWESTSSTSNVLAENICSGFCQLAQLYECLDDLVKTNISQYSSNSSSQIMKQTDDKLVNISVKFLEICGNTTDIISQTLHHVRDFSCGLRRNGGCGIDCIIAKYIVLRTKLKRDVKGSVASLKQVEKMICSSSFMVNSENDPLILVIRAFREVTALSTVIFRLLLVFLAMPPMKTKSSAGCRWTRFSSNDKVVPEEIANANVNELQHLDAALFSYSKSDKRELIHVLPKKLEALEGTLESINSHLHLISRRMIGTRASLLNMVSFY